MPDAVCDVCFDTKSVIIPKRTQNYSIQIEGSQASAYEVYTFPCPKCQPGGVPEERLDIHHVARTFNSVFFTDDVQGQIIEAEKRVMVREIAQSLLDQGYIEFKQINSMEHGGHAILTATLGVVRPAAMDTAKQFIANAKIKYADHIAAEIIHRIRNWDAAFEARHINKQDAAMIVQSIVLEFGRRLLGHP